MDTLITAVYILLALFGLILFWFIAAALSDVDFWSAVFKLIKRVFSSRRYKANKTAPKKHPDKDINPIVVSINDNYDHIDKSV